MSIRLLLADGQRLLRTGFRTVLGAEPDLSVVAESGDGAEVLDLARRLRPDILLVDLGLPRDGAIPVIRALAGIEVRVLVLAEPTPGEDAAAALRAGAAGLVAKDLPGPELAAAIRAVAVGHAVIAPMMLRGLLDGAPMQRAAEPLEPGRPGPDPRLAGLTDREREVLAEIGRGWSNAEIAAALDIGETTVKTHVGRLLTKLSLRDRVAAAILAHEVGLTTPPKT